MRFQIAAPVLFAIGALANSIQFENLDSIPKTIYFTAQEDMAGAPASISLPALGSYTWTTSAPWIGNFYSVNEGENNVPGMLGEVNFADPTTVWYDVSAIVNPGDNLGVKELWAGPNDPISGCDSYATTCDNAYNAPNDIQTKSTTTTRDLYCSVGLAGATKRDTIVETVVQSVNAARSHARDFLSSVKKAL